MNVELIMSCLGIMVKGMIGIFIVILVIWGLVALLGRLTADKGGTKEEPAPVKAAPAAAQEENQEVLVVAASAALAEALGTDVAGLRIVSFKKCAE